MEPILQEDSNEVSSLEKIVTRMSFEELNEATNNFNTTNAIGSGPMGTMYKAMLPNGFFLAIKRVSNSQQFDEHIMTELKTLGRLRHRNLVPLIGFSVESHERLLMYKYMSNGNLYDRLHTKKREDKTMGWNLRVKVAIGLAKALAWLHHTCYLRIAHLNISSRCVLLDQNFEPKLSNFTEAVIFSDFSNTSTIIINNDFMESGCMKEDVYSFGVVLLEMIIGEDPSEILSASRNDYYEWVTRVLGYSSGFYDHIDKVLVEKGFDGEIFQFIKLGCDCVQPFSDRRPTMLQVYETIKLIGEKHVTDDHS